MGARTQYRAGTVSWVDLATTDVDGAKRFYTDLFGWDYDDQEAGGGAIYSMARLGGDNVAAINAQREDERAQGVPAHWNNYVTVEDVDASAARAGELGGAVYAEPFDVLTAGRMAVIADPAGAVLCLWQAGDNIGATRVNEYGCLTWNDCVSTDPDAARSFYEGLFGWRYEGMGEGGTEYFVCFNGERSNGGLLKTPQEGMPSFWYPYFAVENVDDAKSRIESLGGTSLIGPQEIPAGRFLVASDPQGAMFGVTEGELDD
ncbi:MAG TPA: VOC family protein [Thermoleophilaceae bacterium]